VSNAPRKEDEAGAEEEKHPCRFKSVLFLNPDLNPKSEIYS
jgi:hypothetical protein